MSIIRFKSKLVSVGSHTLLVLPKSASEKLPSRGMVMVEGTINESKFQAPLEPDGRGSHWLKVDKATLKNTGASVGDTLTLVITPSQLWPEPTVPTDLPVALITSSKVYTLWKDITPMARWDWIRWIRSTKDPETRKRRIEVMFSKLKAGSRRPCCFNRTICTVPDVSHNGVLLNPAQAKTIK
ncbi:MAG: YdeI/OmpD-associated family protein [Patescibacteria group bacterium]